MSPSAAFSSSLSSLLRQPTPTPAPTPTPPPDSLSPITRVSIIGFVGAGIALIISILLVVLIRYFLRRRSCLERRNYLFSNDNIHAQANLQSDAPTVQSPALVRRQRYAVSNPGLTIEELAPVAPVEPFVKDDAEDCTCPVCLEEMLPQAKIRRLPCSHAFDAKCIEDWAVKANRCPVCNTHIIDQEQLHSARLAAIDPNHPSHTQQNTDHSPTNTPQRRRRARGENGSFLLTNGTLAQTHPPSPDIQQSQV